MKIKWSNGHGIKNADWRRLVMGFLFQVILLMETEIFRFCQLAYDTPSKLRFGSYTIMSSEGVQQGDPLGPLLFCLTIHPLLQTLNSEFKFGYLDDITIGDKMSVVSDDVNYLLSASKEIGLVLNSQRSVTVPTHISEFVGSTSIGVEYTGSEVASVRVTSHDQPITTTLTQDGHLSEISITLNLTRIVYVLDLHINSMLFASSYHEKILTEDNSIDRPVNHVQDHCHYIGTVRGYTGSIAAISVCSGISGQFIIDGSAYHVTSLGDSLLCDVTISKTTDETSVRTCGQNADVFPFEHAHRNKVKRSFDWPQDLNPITKVVELYVAIDNFQYQAFNKDDNLVISRAKSAVNIVSSLYQPLNVYVVLVGLELWTGGNKIEVLSGNVTETLSRFLRYRQTSITTPNDNAQLITSTSFDGGVVGKAPVGLMCSVSQSGAVCADVNSNVATVASTMAHEMGHNFGLIHDTSNCKCNDKVGFCIMYPSSGGSNPATKWSDCSVSQLSQAFQSGADFCLHNKLPTIYDSTVRCGNGIIESGEQCDCGQAPVSECNPSCCNATTCQLTNGGQCASGGCCYVDTCKLKSQGEVCRSSLGDCDLPESCNGQDRECPFDVFKQDGLQCSASGVAAYCYNGKCESHTSHCQMLWGSYASKAIQRCYDQNALGTVHANCGAKFDNPDQPTYLNCSKADVLCGKLQCDKYAQNLAYFTQFYLISQIDIGADMCRSVIYDLVGQGLQDPGLVSNGAQCGDNKMCVRQKCVDVSSILDLTSPCPSNCSGAGVCNSLGECHCNADRAPPDCSKPGTGGSYHSNGISTNSSNNKAGLIAGLVIGLTALLIICLLLIYFCCCRQGARGKSSNPFQGCLEKFASKSSQRLSSGVTRQDHRTSAKPTRVAPKPARQAPAPPRPSNPNVFTIPVAPARPAPVAPSRPAIPPLPARPQPPNRPGPPPKPTNGPSGRPVYPSSFYNQGYTDTEVAWKPCPPPKPGYRGANNNSSEA